MKVDNINEAIVTFLTVKEYGGAMAVPDNLLDNTICSGRLEYVFNTKDGILADKLRKLMKQQDTFFPQLKPIREWLDKENIKYYISPRKVSL